MLVVANQSLEVKLVSWGSVGVDVDWKITKDGLQVAKGKILRAASQKSTEQYECVSSAFTASV